MAKRAKGELIDKRYMVNGKVVDINRYLAPKSPLPHIPESCQKYVTKSFDDIVNSNRHETIELIKEYVNPTFECSLCREQLLVLLPMLNHYIFSDEQNIDDVEALFKCKLEKPIRIKNNRYLAYLLSNMAAEQMICYNWSQVSEINQLFASELGNVISASNLTTSLQRFVSIKNNLNERIDEIKDAIKSAVNGVKG